MKGHPAIVKKSFANRPSQADQKYVFTKDGRKVRNIAYNPQFEKLSYNTSVLNLPNKTKDTYIDTLDGVTRFFDDDGELHRDDGPPPLNMRAEVRNTGDTGNFTEMAVPHLCTLMGQKNGTRTVNITAKVAPLQSPLMVQENGTGMGTFTGRMAPLLSGARNAPCSGSTSRAGTTTMMPRYPALKENGG